MSPEEIAQRILALETKLELIERFIAQLVPPEEQAVEREPQQVAAPEDQSP